MEDKLTKIKKLENVLRDICNNIKIDKSKEWAQVDGFTIWFSNEDATIISYVKNLPKDAQYVLENVDFKKKVNWPYTGFIEGDLFQHKPISPEEILTLLEKYNTDINDFVKRKNFIYKKAHYLEKKKLF